MYLRMGFALLALATAFVAPAQTAPRFEAASVKPTEYGGTHVSDASAPDPGHFRAQNSTLDELIRTAWNLKDGAVSGPVWLNDSSIAFDIIATAPASATKDEMRLMLRTLLTDRFQLASHFETKMLSGYELTVGKKGAKLTPASTDERRSTGGTVGINATKVSMSNFADYLARDLKMPVIDQTGISGAFDIHFLYAREPDPNSAPSIFTAIEESTGLLLKPAKVPVQILVVDHVEKMPMAN